MSRRALLLSRNERSKGLLRDDTWALTAVVVHDRTVAATTTTTIAEAVVREDNNMVRGWTKVLEEWDVSAAKIGRNVPVIFGGTINDFLRFSTNAITGS
jgi:hypothetical protein